MTTRVCSLGSSGSGVSNRSLSGTPVVDEPAAMVAAILVLPVSSASVAYHLLHYFRGVKFIWPPGPDYGF